LRKRLFFGAGLANDFGMSISLLSRSRSLFSLNQSLRSPLAMCIAAGVLTLGLSGCGGRIISEEDALDSIRAQPMTSELTLPLDGRYVVTAHSPESGSVQGLMYAAPTEKGFTANTRPGAAGELIRVTEGWLLAAVGGMVFPGGAIARWESTLPGANADGTPTPGEGEVKIGPLTAAKTKIQSPGEPIEVYNTRGRLVGFVTIEPAPESAAEPQQSLSNAESQANGGAAPAQANAPSETPSKNTPALADSGTVAADAAESTENDGGTIVLPRAGEKWTPNPMYAEIATNAEKALREKLYDASLVETPKVKAYLRGLKRSAEIARDDVEFSFGAALSAATNLPFSQTVFQRAMDPELEKKLRGSPLHQRPKQPQNKADANEEQPADDFARVAFDAFQMEPAKIDDAMRAALAESPPALIIDLRDCRAGSYAGMRIVSWLVSEPLEGGVIAGPTGRAAALEKKFAEMPRTPFTAIETNDSLTAAMARSAAIVAIAEPRSDAEVFSGPVAVLVNRRTQGSAEMLADMLKRRPNTIIVGQKTAGRAIHTQPVDVGFGWMYRVPCYDVFTMAGDRIDRSGITPTVMTESDNADKMAAQRLKAMTQSAMKP
jgi:hypothetical protein